MESKTETRIKLILAQDGNNGIGYKGKLPWPLCKDDMRLFKCLTTGNGNNKNAVVMGYDTWKSLPTKYKPLPNRVNIVLSVNHYDELINEDKCLVFNSWENFKKHIKALKCSCEEIWVIGGAKIYRGAIDNLPITNIIRTAFKQSYLCDCYLNINGLLINKGITFNKSIIKETEDYVMEHLQIE